VTTTALGETPPSRSARRTRNMRRWRRRSAVIAVVRWALPGVILLIVAAFTGWLVFGDLLSRAAPPGAAPQSIHMTNARFLGRDEKGHAYVLAAARAERDNIDFARITLDHPSLVMDADSASPTRLTADSGVYREDNRILMLNGHVRLADETGDSFSTNEATVDTVKGAVAGRAAVISKGPSGGITADSYAVYDKGQRVVFQGEVHSRLNAH
jgi:lipopolysaccharide export system protein LptC